MKTTFTNIQFYDLVMYIYKKQGWTNIDIFAEYDF